MVRLAIKAYLQVPRYVYHATKSENVASILKNGLNLSCDLDGKQCLSASEDLQASKELVKERQRWDGAEYTILRIDTSSLSNTWIEDKQSLARCKAIRTEQPIPPNVIEIAEVVPKKRL